MTAVPDVSGIMEILLETEKGERYNALLQEADFVITPDLYVPELTNTLWKYCTIQKMPKEKCTQLIRIGITYIDRFVDSKTLWEEAFAEGAHTSHSVYDMLYLITARRTDGILVTNDGPLVKVCGLLNVKTCA